MKSLKEAIECMQAGEIQPDDVPRNVEPQQEQFIVRENSKKPGEPIFVRGDGKVGFPTINSRRVEIGDTVRGRIQVEEDTYFLFEVREVI